MVTMVTCRKPIDGWQSTWPVVAAVAVVSYNGRQGVSSERVVRWMRPNMDQFRVQCRSSTLAD